MKTTIDNKIDRLVAIENARLLQSGIRKPVIKLPDANKPIEIMLVSDVDWLISEIKSMREEVKKLTSFKESVEYTVDSISLENINDNIKNG